MTVFCLHLQQSEVRAIVGLLLVSVLVAGWAYLFFKMRDSL